MKILITAPSLNPNVNIGGVVTVVNTIIDNNNKHTYFHYILGRPDHINSTVGVFIKTVYQIIRFPYYVKKHRIELIHQNLPLEPW